MSTKNIEKVTILSSSSFRLSYLYKRGVFQNHSTIIPSKYSLATVIKCTMVKFLIYFAGTKQTLVYEFAKQISINLVIEKTRVTRAPFAFWSFAQLRTCQSLCLPKWTLDRAKESYTQMYSGRKRLHKRTDIKHKRNFNRTLFSWDNAF